MKKTRNRYRWRSYKIQMRTRQGFFRYFRSVKANYRKFEFDMFGVCHVLNNKEDEVL